MAYRRRDEWEDNSQVYTERQIEAVLEECGVEIVGETVNDYLSYCPYHGNDDTPAFSTSKKTGVSLCFNPSCGKWLGNGDNKKFCPTVRGLDALVMEQLDLNNFQALRLIIKKRKESLETISDRLAEALARPDAFVEFSQEVLDKNYEDFWNTQHAIDYMRGRGFDDDTLRYFRVGYSNKPDKRTKKPKNMIIVPMHDPKGMPVGLIGRSASDVDKVFKNSKGLPKRETLFNLHRAKRYETVIVVESAFDAMRVHQAGFPNVVATLGIITDKQMALLNRHFSTIIIFTDNDPFRYEPNCRKCSHVCLGHKPGRALGRQIQKQLKNKKILWAGISPGELYPANKKDATDMDDHEISLCVKSAVTTFEYNSWKLDAPGDLAA